MGLAWREWQLGESTRGDRIARRNGVRAGRLKTGDQVKDAAKVKEALGVK